MPAIKRPRRGSMAFWPRVRAKRPYPRIKSWPAIDEVKPLGFGGYKAGMGHAILIDTNPNSRTRGQEIVRAVTVLDCPPLTVFGFRAYVGTSAGLRAAAEIISPKLSKALERKVKIKPKALEQQLKKLDGKKIKVIRLFVHTNPHFKKKPEVFELGLGGKEQLEYAKSMLGKQLKVSELFRPGDYVDVFAVTKGKGTEGPVKRFGIRIHGRKAEHMHRKVGAKGPREPGKVRYTVPQAGQLGWQSRCELNKRILGILPSEKVRPAGGFLRYGLPKGEVLLLDGSVPGTSKRLIRLRLAIRPPKKIYPVELKSVVI